MKKRKKKKCFFVFVLFFFVAQKKNFQNPTKTFKKTTKMAKGKSGSGGKRVKKAVKGSTIVTNGSIRRLARRGGVKRISKDVYDNVRSVIRGFSDGVIRDATAYTEHSKRKTVSVGDIVAALRKRGRSIYGY
jgi:histone H4